mmetsp:Transcript_14701/g.31379  ORF Transcript_14701/g.31379 Transcript_14701/m.31379 type:complete len:266 (-) Transcript_14701:160-957(-)
MEAMLYSAASTRSGTASKQPISMVHLLSALPCCPELVARLAIALFPWQVQQGRHGQVGDAPTTTTTTTTAESEDGYSSFSSSSSLASSSAGIRINDRASLITRTRRVLHELPYEHGHYFQPQTTIYTNNPNANANEGIDDDITTDAATIGTGTEAPMWYYDTNDDDKYHIDDGAIDETMIREKKELYERERSESNSNGVGSSSSINSIISGNDNGNDNENDGIAEREQALTSGTSSSAIGNSRRIGSGINININAMILVGFVYFC